MTKLEASEKAAESQGKESEVLVRELRDAEARQKDKAAATQQSLQELEVQMVVVKNQLETTTRQAQDAESELKVVIIVLWFYSARAIVSCMLAVLLALPSVSGGFGVQVQRATVLLAEAQARAAEDAKIAMTLSMAEMAEARKESSLSRPSSPSLNADIEGFKSQVVHATTKTFGLAFGKNIVLFSMLLVWKCN